MYFNFDLNFNMTLSSADNPFKQFGPKIRPHILSGPDRGQNCLTLKRLLQVGVEPMVYYCVKPLHDFVSV